MTKQLIALGILGMSFVSGAQTQVYYEDFDNGLPISYTIVDNDGLTPDAATLEFSDAWIALPDPLDSTDTIVGSTSYFDPIGTADRWLITPQITLGAFGNSISWEGRSHDASFPDGYFVMASSTDTQISSFTDTLLVVNAELASWNTRSVNLSEFGLDGQQVHIAFVNRTYDGFKLYLDSITATIEDPVGVNELTKQKLRIFPNPAADQINFNLEGDQVTIYGLHGQQVLRESNVNSISIGVLPSGVYWIELINNGNVYREKVIKN